MRASTSRNQANGSILFSSHELTNCAGWPSFSRHDHCRGTSSCGDRVPSRIHSAHIGREVEVHYRWHPLYGRRLRVLSSERRASGPVIHVAVARGTVTILPHWMVDAVVCAGMALGPPRISIDALSHLRLLLLERGFGRSFCDDSPIVAKNPDKRSAQDSAGTVTATCRAAPDEYCVRIEGPARPIHSGANESSGEPGPSVDAGGRGRGRGGRR